MRVKFHPAFFFSHVKLNKPETKEDVLLYAYYQLSCILIAGDIILAEEIRILYSAKLEPE